VRSAWFSVRRSLSLCAVAAVASAAAAPDVAIVAIPARAPMQWGIEIADTTTPTRADEGRK
jgi:hypothetical protein